jgi:hypothetical protein
MPLFLHRVNAYIIWNRIFCQSMVRLLIILILSYTNVQGNCISKNSDQNHKGMSMSCKDEHRKLTLLVLRETRRDLGETLKQATSK